MRSSVLKEAVGGSRIVVRERNEFHSDDGSTLARSLRDAVVHLQVRPGHALGVAAGGDEIDVYLVDPSTYPYSSAPVRKRGKPQDTAPGPTQRLFVAWAREEELGPSLGRLLRVKLYSPIKRDDQELESTFLELAEEWRLGVAETSSYSEMVSHPAYLRIISLGVKAIPLIFRELQREPDHWFLALHILTGADPVRPESRARLREMAEDWLGWGRLHGY